MDLKKRRAPVETAFLIHKAGIMRRDHHPLPCRITQSVRHEKAPGGRPGAFSCLDAGAGFCLSMTALTLALTGVRPPACALRLTLLVPPVQPTPEFQT